MNSEPGSNGSLGVSVIMPAYNASKYIGEAIESVKAQTFQDWELIIVDDGSTDNTAEIVSNYLDDKRIKLVSQNNEGPSAARNRGVAVSSAEWVALLDADDIWYPQKLETQLKHADSTMNFIVTDQHIIKGRERTKDLYSLDNPIDNANPLHSLLFKNNFISTSTVLFSRKLFNLAGGFDGQIRGCEDLDLWVRFFEAGADLVCMPQPLGAHRLSPNSTSANNEVMLWGNYLLVNNYSQRQGDAEAHQRAMEFLFEYLKAANHSGVAGLKERFQLAVLASKFGLVSKIFVKQVVLFFRPRGSKAFNASAQKTTFDLALATASDSFYANEVLNLVGSLKANSNIFDQILIYDLGMKFWQKIRLRGIPGVVVRPVKAFTPHWRQCWSWKPWVWDNTPAKIVVYLDAGTEVLRNLGELVEQVQKDGYLVVSQFEALEEGHVLGDIIPREYYDIFKLSDSFKSKPVVAAGILGFKQNSVFHNKVVKGTLELVLQGYNLGWSEVELFRNRGIHQMDQPILRDCRLFRHDQTLFNMMFYKFVSKPSIQLMEKYGGTSRDSHKEQLIWNPRKRGTLKYIARLDYLKYQKVKNTYNICSIAVSAWGNSLTTKLKWFVSAMFKYSRKLVK